MFSCPVWQNSVGTVGGNAEARLGTMSSTDFFAKGCRPVTSGLQLLANGLYADKVKNPHWQFTTGVSPKLARIQLLIKPFLCHRFLVRALFHHIPMIYHQNMIGILDGREPVRDSEQLFLALGDGAAEDPGVLQYHRVAAGQGIHRIGAVLGAVH